MFIVKVYLLFVICYQFLFNVNNIRKHDFLKLRCRKPAGNCVWRFGSKYKTVESLWIFHSYFYVKLIDPILVILDK